MKDASEDTRQKAILTSAFQAFAAYGFRKTSMDDIARGAGMSRPAVYLHYKNKEDIVRRLTQLHYDEKINAVEQALSADGSVSGIITQAIQAQTDGMAAILASPHGLEMLDMSKSVSTDIVETGEARLTDLYTAWLAREDAAGRVRLNHTPADVAKTITSTLIGIKMTASGAAEFENCTARLAALIGAGLEVR